jgi:hypothetical protein
MGRVGMLMAPTSMIIRAQTVEKTGRLIKKSTNIGLGIGGWGLGIGKRREMGEMGERKNLAFFFLWS